jgi:hypothetical protein
VVSEGKAATGAAQGKAAPQLPTIPSLSRHAVAATAAHADATASVASGSEPVSTSVQKASTLPLLTPALKAKPNFARNKLAAAKPGAPKRPLNKSKAPALVTIAEDAASPATGAAGKMLSQLTAVAPHIDRSTLKLAVPDMHAASAQPPLTTEAAVAKPAARQRTKAADLDANAVHARVMRKHAENKLMDLLVEEAKCWLKSRKLPLPLKGKKEELMARIAENILQP